ncbi:unnamed protein product [Linum tenue]|uniref:Uncharacterized protein n=1 Tax=Linum tenue TaxID=586396 RepID=A0AAV0IWU7_9ROSI|nr:unnamed protein product [Linum tenue]
MATNFPNFTLLLLLLFLTPLIFQFPHLVSSECTCDRGTSRGGDGHRDGNKPILYKIVAICSILAASGIGVTIPIAGRKFPALHPENNLFFLIKAFAAGVILATGFVHILPDAFASLSSPCVKENPWARFPFPGLFAMVAAVMTMMIDTFATSYYKRSHFSNTNKALPVAGSGNDSSGVLEIGIVVHSVIIGVSLGASGSTRTIKPLVAALTFHQFFEGLGLGGCISQAKFKFRVAATMMLFFSLTTPIGIVVGICISRGYSEDSQAALLVSGILNSASAGILIYMALVDLLAQDFMNPKLQGNLRLQLGANVSLLLGMGCMSSLARLA